MESVHMHVREEKIKSPVEEWEAWSRSKHSVKPILASFISTEINIQDTFLQLEKKVD